MTPLEKKLELIEKILDQQWRDPDEALTWHTYGFQPADVQRFMAVGILDPHTARSLETLGVRLGILEHTYEETKAKAVRPRTTPETVPCPACGETEFRLDSSGTVDCVACGVSVELQGEAPGWVVVEPQDE